MSISTIRLVLWALVGLAVVAVGGLFAWTTLRGPQVAALGDLLAPSDAIGGDFALVDQDGKPVTREALKGRPAAMFFGFTHCPDVCPTTLAEAGQWLAALGPDAGKLQFVFVSVDPERDTPEALKQYLSAFDERIRGLTGSQEAVDRVIKAYRVYARKVQSGSSYVMDHTAAVYLMNADQRFVGTINYQEPTDKALAKLRQLIGNG
ncbi:SCO family protein [Prosthecomicrobium sp. N25]|uniref:SCO family protein n=1 Tax=Prosthecomicrobium sp. N25 TaxID=3129254 RepID=UPI003077FE91